MRVEGRRVGVEKIEGVEGATSQSSDSEDNSYDIDWIPIN